MAALKTLVDYGAPFQVKTIGALLTRKEFVQNIYDILSDEHFPNPAHKWIINEILQYWNKYHTVISMDTLKIEVKDVMFDAEVDEFAASGNTNHDGAVGYVDYKGDIDIYILYFYA